MRLLDFQMLVIDRQKFARQSEEVVNFAAIT